MNVSSKNPEKSWTRRRPPAEAEPPGVDLAIVANRALERVGHVDAEAVAVAEVGLDLRRHVAGVDDDLIDAMGAQVLDEKLHQRPAEQRNHRLRHHVCVSGRTRVPAPAARDHCFHRAVRGEGLSLRWE